MRGLRGRKGFKRVDALMGGLLCRLTPRPGRRGPKEEPPRTIVISKLAAMGDTILLLPHLHLIREAFPNARMIALASSVNRDVFDLWGGMDRIVEWSPAATLKAVSEIRKERADTAVDFEQWTHVTTLVLAWAGVPRRIGFATAGFGRGRLYTDPVSHDGRVHEGEMFGRLLGPLGVQPAAGPPSVSVPFEPRAAIGARISAAGLRRGAPIVVIHPGCGAHGWQREWPAARYAAVIDALADAKSCAVVITGSAGERALAEEVGGQCRTPSWVAAGELSLLDLAALVAEAGVVVCGNTGIVHLSEAVGTPVVAIHGPTDPIRWGPRDPRSRTIKGNLPCSPCLTLGFEYACSGRQCMEAVGTREVAAAAGELIGAARTEPRTLSAGMPC
ncbi:MAG: hypothetical protein A2V83_09735 [Nitrospirae bacterium RBG_16_64_22]|nr:MAG: hypothetical protein A2V83_09735 [Nitrospirae bacterium RBG_16_64_22]